MSEIGKVVKLDGNARVTGADGVTRPLTNGDPVSQGDRVETVAGSELTIVFSDGTNFYLAGEASMVLDELVYDPAGSDNSVSVELIQGLFVFVAGEAAKTGGMVIETPTGQIGVRGTTVGIFIDPATGATRIANLAHPLNDEVGRFVFINAGGTTVFSIENQELLVFDAFSAHASLVLQNPVAITRLFGHGLEVLSQSGDFQRSDVDDGAPQPTQAASDDASGDSIADDGLPLSGGSGAAAGLTAAMESLSSSTDGSDGSGDLISLLSASSDLSTPSGFSTTTTASGGSDTWASLYIGFVWSGGAGDGLWHASNNWYIGDLPDDGSDVWVEESGAFVYYIGDTAVSLWVSNLTLEGSTLSIQTGKLGVQSLLTVGGGATLLIDGGTFASSGSTALSGNITVQSGNLEIIGGSFVSRGTFLLDTGGNVIVSGGSVENTGSMTVEADADFSGSQWFTNSGSLFLGSGLTTLSLDGHFEQSSGGTVYVQIGSAGHDLVNITGTARLSGQLGIELLGGYVPNAGDSFVILTAGQIELGFGSFVDESITATRQWTFSPTSTAVELIASDKPSSGADQIYGTADPDFLRGYGGADQIFGNANDDILQGDDGADQLDGEAGSDTASFASSPSGVIANLSGTTQMGVLSGEASDGYGNTDTLTSIENLDGSGSDDFFFGDGSDNFFDGHEGSDELTGNGGSDTFGLREGDGGPTVSDADVITDYTDGTDLFGLLDGLSFGDLTIDDGGTSSTEISVTATGEFLALVQFVPDTAFDSGDFITV